MANIFKPIKKATFSTPERQSMGILDDYAVRKSEQTRELEVQDINKSKRPLTIHGEVFCSGAIISPNFASDPYYLVNSGLWFLNGGVWQKLISGFAKDTYIGDGYGKIFLDEGGRGVISTGGLSGAYFASTCATGIAPHPCTSTTLNTNLNADLLDGNHATAFEAAQTKGNLTATSPLSFDNTRQVIGGAAVVSIANAAADGATKGAAAFNATNFTASTGVINTIQNIATTSSPQFANLVLTAGGDIKPSSNSTTAINIAQADGTNIAVFDTTNKFSYFDNLRLKGGDTTNTIYQNAQIGISNGGGGQGIVIESTGITQNKATNGTDGDLKYTFKIFDKTALGAGVGGGIAFQGAYTADIPAIWAGISGNKDNGTDGNYAGNLNFYTREQGGNLTSRMNITSAGHIKITADSKKLYFGAGDDCTIYYDGSNMIINPKDVGSGILDIAGTLQTDGYKAVDGTAALAGTKTYYVSDSSGGAVNRKLTFKDGLLVAET